MAMVVVAPHTGRTFFGNAPSGSCLSKSLEGDAANFQVFVKHTSRDI